MLARLRQLWNGRPSARRTMPRPRRLGLEQLEDRSLLSFTLNPTTPSATLAPLATSVVPDPVNVSGWAAGDQSESAVAAQGGRNVVVWTDQVSATNTDIKARVYSPTSVPTTRWITVANTPALERDPAVAMDAAGNFVVVWGEKGSIKGARYSAAGTKLGGTFTIAKANTGYVERFGITFEVFVPFVSYYDPSVAMDGAGNFVVTHLRFDDISAVMYTAGGSRTRTIQIGSGESAAVARNADGRFAVAYDGAVGSDDQIKLQTFAADGTPIGTYALTQPLGTQEDVARPSVAIDDFGNCVVAYERLSYRHYQLDTDVLARTVSSAGVLSYVMPISTTPFPEARPVVAMDRSDGDFVVAFEADMPFAGRRVGVNEMSATGAVKASIDAGAANLSQPAICINERDEYYLTFTAVDWTDPITGALDPGQGIVMRQRWLV
jgi:hypothetical protein